MSSWFFSSTPSVSSTTSASSTVAVERDERRRPVERLGHAGGLYSSTVRSSWTNAVTCCGEPLGRARHLRRDDAEFLVEVRIVDPA